MNEQPFQVGDIVLLKPCDEIGVSFRWTKAKVHGLVRITRIHGQEHHAESLEFPELSRAEDWFFWENEMIKDAYLTAIWRRRHGV